MKKVIKITIILIIFLFGLRVDASTCKSNIDLYSYNYCNSNINIHIIDQDDKDINNIKLELYDSNNNIIKKASIEEKGFYTFNILNDINKYNDNIDINYKLEQNYDYNYNLLPNKYKKIINSINSITDIKKLNNKEITIKNDKSTYALFFNIPFYIKQTNNYKNYEKINIVIPATVQVTYFFRDCDYKKTNKCFPVKNKTIDIVLSKDGYYDYNEDINYLKYLNSDSQKDIIQKTCKDDNCYLEIKDKIKDLNIILKSTIKNKTTVITRRGKLLNVNIKVLNDDDKESNNNIITTYLDKDIIVVPNSISDYGVLDEKNNTITWNIELIDNKSSFNLSYDAYINNNANTNKVFSTHLTLKSNIVDTITSNNTSIILIENTIFGVIKDIIFILITLFIFYKIIDIRNKNMKKDRN